MTRAAVLTALLFSGSAWASGSVEVTSRPRGGAIFVDGKDTEKTTPATISGLADGSHEIAVRGDCVAARQTVTVEPGVTPIVALELAPQDGTLELSLTPSTASVELDGAPLAWSPGVPVLVTCGSHRLKVTAKGYQTELVDVRAVAGDNSVIALVLDELGTGRLEIDVAPTEATVWLDERKLGTGPQQLDVTAGPHALRAGHEGYLDQERQVLVEVGEDLPVAFSLQPVSTNTTVIVQKDRGRRPWIGLTVAGIGVAGLAWGTTEYLQGQSGWAEFQDRRGEIEDGHWPDSYDDDPKEWAYDVYDSKVKNHRTRMLIGDIVGGVLLTGGLLMTFAI